VARLSNLFAIGARSVGRAEARLVSPDEQAAVVAMVLGSPRRPAPLEHVREYLAMTLLRAGEISAAGVVTVAGRTRFAALMNRAPGRTSLLMAAGDTHGGLGRAIGELLTRLLRVEREAGTRLVQSLLPTGSPLAGMLREAAGFEHLAVLRYLDKRARACPAPEWPAGVDRLSFTTERAGLFLTALSRSYEGSLDCPGLAGRRALEDVLLGHRAAGHFDPSNWHVLLENERPIGCLLLGGLGIDGGPGQEVVYLGLAPEARGRGLAGRLLGLAETTAAGGRLVLAVDADNRPALRLYRRHGLAGRSRRLALLRDLQAG
jgi:ribosomal protein S18 acetylase RimI-like enzyme